MGKKHLIYAYLLVLEIYFTLILYNTKIAKSRDQIAKMDLFLKNFLNLNGEEYCSFCLLCTIYAKINLSHSASK